MLIYITNQQIKKKALRDELRTPSLLKSVKNKRIHVTKLSFVLFQQIYGTKIKFPGYDRQRIISRVNNHRVGNYLRQDRC